MSGQYLNMGGSEKQAKTEKQPKVWPRGDEKKAIKAKLRAEKEATGGGNEEVKKDGKNEKKAKYSVQNVEKSGVKKRPRDDGANQVEKAGEYGEDHEQTKKKNRGPPPKKGFQNKFLEGTFCLCCRAEGHTMSQCRKIPTKVGGKEGERRDVKKSKLTCFNCGKDGHNLKKCPQPLVAGGLKFATCFICHEVGHISAKCPQNTHGIYPKGGACKVCGDIWHLAKDCPQKGSAKDKKAQVAAKTTKAPLRGDDGSVESLVGNTEYDSKNQGGGKGVNYGDEESASVKKKKKIVKF